MKLDIVIPTYNRPLKLLKCVASIIDAMVAIPDHNTYIYVYCSNQEDYEYTTNLFESLRSVLVRFLTVPYKAANFWNNHIATSSFDIMFYLNDDVLLHPACLINAIKAMETNFPDLDGVIGLYQENLPETDTVKTAFGAIGDKFLSRFPNKKVFCEDYERFYLDKELELFSAKINRLILSKEASLIHCHPAYNALWDDFTHKDVRTHLAGDRLMFMKRQRKHLLWGENFTLLKK